MAANAVDPSRLLSIQSHVVTGFVGNRSATFPLQLLGWDVDVVNTTQLSNHTGYGRWGGSRMDDKHLHDLLFKGLVKNGLCRWARMLTGYIPSPAALSVVADFISHVRSGNPDLIYLLDPVMGDIGRGYYVDKGCLSIYRQLLPMATIACPNQFEAQELAGLEIDSLSSLLTVLARLHVFYGVPNVVITSVELPDSAVSSLGAVKEVEGQPAMLLVGSSYARQSKAGASEAELEDEVAQVQLKPWSMQFPEKQGYFSGVGDLFSALVLGRYETASTSSADGEPHQSSLARAAEYAIAGVQAVLEETERAMASAAPIPPRPEMNRLTSVSSAVDKLAMSRSSSGTGLQDRAQEQEEQAVTDEEREKQERVEHFRRRELKLIQARKEIENPQVKFKAWSWREEVLKSARAA